MAAKKMTVRDAYSKAKKQERGGTLNKGSKRAQQVKRESKSQNPSSRNKIGVKPKNKKGPWDDIARGVVKTGKIAGAIAKEVSKPARDPLGAAVDTIKGIRKDVKERNVKGLAFQAATAFPVGRIAKGAKVLAKGADAAQGAATVASNVAKGGKKAAKAVAKSPAPKGKTPDYIRKRKAIEAKEAKRKASIEDTKPKKPSAAVVDTQDAARKRIQASEKKMAEMRKSGKHVKNGELVGEYKRLDAEILSLRKKVLSSTPKREPRKGNPVTNFRMKAVRREGTDKRLAESIEGGMVNKRTGEVRRVHEEVERRPSKKGALQKEGKTELQLDKANLRAGRNQQDDILLGKRRGLTNEKNVIKGWKAQEKKAVSNLKRLERRLNQANLTPKQKASAVRAQTRNRIQLRNIRSELNKQAKQSYRTDTEDLGRRYRSR